MRKFDFAAWAALLILLPVAARAEPITTAIALFAASSATAAFVVRIGISLVLTALSTALQKKPGQARRAGIKTEATTTGGNNPQTFILGRYATSGNMVAPPYSHPNDGSVPNKYLTYVVDLSDMPGSQFSRIMVAGEYITDLVASDGDHDLEGMFDGDTPHMFLTWHDGSQTVADPYMLANYGDHPDRPWTSDMVGTGLTYAVLTFVYNRKMFNNLPGVRFEVDGLPLYDPRKDASVGGSGAHRWGDPATCEFTTNNAVMVYNILRGITLPDGRIWGGRALSADLPLDNMFAAMNECDLDIALADGGSEPQYRAGLEVSLDQEPAGVIEELLKACSGEITEIGGTYKLRIGPPALPVYFFTDDDVVIDEPQSLTPYPGLDGVHNAIHASHPAPAALWETRDAPPLYNPEWEAEDAGRQLVAQVDLPAVTSDTQVQRLMAGWIRDERRFRRHGLTLPPDAAILEPLDSAAWTSAKNGYSAKVFEIGEQSDDLTTLLQTVSMRERDGNDFAWVPGTDEISVTYPSTRATAPTARVVPGWVVVAASVLDANGIERRPALLASWIAASVSDALALEIEVRAAGQAALVAQVSVTDLDRGTRILSEGIMAGQSYEVRARLVMPVQDTFWTDWQPVAAPDIRLGIADLAAEVTSIIDGTKALAQGAMDRHDAALDDIGGAVGDLVARLQTNVGASAIAPVGAPVVPLDTRLAVVAERQQIDLPRLRDSEDGLQAIWEALTSLSAEGFAQNQRLADAGVYEDPTGRVRIMAVVQAEEAVRRAEILVDALAAQVSLSVSHADVSAAVGAALLNPTQNPLVEDLVTRTTDLEVSLDAEKARIDTLSATLLVGGATMSMTTVSTWLNSLDAAMGQRVTVTEFTDMVARQNGVEILLSALDVPEIAFTVSASRQLLDGDEDLAAAQMADQWEALQNRAVQQQADAAAQRSMRAFVDEGFAAQASETATLVAEVDDQRAAMRVESKVRVADGVATAETLQQLQADLGETQATVTTEATARADADSAQAQQITVLQATTGENTAAISTESTARSDADSAQAQQIVILQAATGANTAAVTEEVLARTTANSAVAGQIGVVEAAINPNNEGSIAARLQMVEAAYVTEEEAVAAVETEISASYGDLTALAAATLAAKATADGIQAAYTLRLNGQGVFEMISVADGTTGQSVTGKIASDHFQITGLTQLDSVVLQDLAGANAFLQNLTVTQANMGTAAVGTLHIGDNAVSFDLAAESITALLPANGWRNYMGITIPAGHPARVSFAVTVALELTDPLLGQQWGFELRRRSDGALIVSVGDDVYQGLVSFSGLLGNQPAGTEVYDLYVSFGTGVTLNGAKIIAAVGYK